MSRSQSLIQILSNSLFTGVPQKIGTCAFKVKEVDTWLIEPHLFRFTVLAVPISLSTGRGVRTRLANRNAKHFNAFFDLNWGALFQSVVSYGFRVTSFRL